MIKKLDILILKAFFWPFVATFFIALFVLMMQTIWKYIDDLVGKGLDGFTLLQFIMYASATMVMLALPIAILLSSIMTFGKLGESFELVAIKSSGISLLRFMRPLFFVAVLLGGVTFLFANYIIPVANLKFAVLYNDIYRKSPAFDLKDGVFYNGFRGYSIKVGKKEKDKSTLRNVLIFEQQQSYNVQDNTVTSEKGVMTMSPDRKFLEFKLSNGYRYSEKGEMANTNNEFVRVGFKEYNKLFDLSQLDIQKTADSLFRTGIRMQNARQLGKAIDSLERFPDSFARRARRELGIYLNVVKYKDSATTTVKNEKPAVKKFDDLIPDSLKSTVTERALNTASNLKTILEITRSEADIHSKDLRNYLIEWHKKFSLSTACLVLFLIGAPLGSIIRKGGLGMPLLVAIIFFLIFHLFSIFGEKFVKQDIITPFAGTWLSVMALTPVGLFLTYKASRDSQLFSKEYYYRFFKNIYSYVRPLFNKLKGRIE